MPTKTNGKPTKKDDGATGTYVFDKELGKVVKVSEKVPGLKKKSGKSDFGPGPSCPPEGCGRCA